MRVILNSDITFQPALVRGSTSARLTSLLHACRDHGHIVIVPRTTVYEFRRQQEVLKTRKVTELENALRLLDELGIGHPEVDVEDAVGQEELEQLIRAEGALVEIAEPTHAELLAAHDGACLHDGPMAPDAKSDEMRDLVVWEIGHRYARQRAPMVSNDEVHSGVRGEEEASANGLLRARTIEDALDILEIETPARVLLLTMFQAVWDDLRGAGLPILAAPELRRIREPRFKQGEVGLADASAVVRLAAGTGAEIEARVRFVIEGARIVQVSMHSTQSSELELGAELKVERPWNAPALDLNARLQDLRDVLETQ